MKANLSTIIGMLGSVFMASCSTSTIDELDITQIPIGFGTSVSRAAVNDVTGISSFSVWGGYDGTNNLFEKTTVTKDGLYEGDARYWIPNKTFNFYAVHPVIDNVTVDDLGQITITGFDCSATGTAAIDLMTAENIGIEYIDETPGPVEMRFSHKLSRLKFTVKAENDVTATVTNAKLYGVIYKGDYSSENGDTWSNTERYTETTTTFKYEPTDPQPLTTTGIENIFSDILIIPDSDIEGTILELTYFYDDYSISPVTKRINVKTNQIPGWEKGQNYSYTVTIGPNNIQFQPIVTPWNHSTGGIITVNKPISL